MSEEDISDPVNIAYSSQMTVKLIRASAADDHVVQAAQVSAKGENNPDTVPERLINALMAGRHGSPFEHSSFTFFIEAPIFVFREWQRHRISSFNEMSGRYTTLLPKFYVPGPTRPTFNVGTKMKPVFEQAPVELKLDTKNVFEHNSEASWEHYQWLLKQGVANEVARMVLPLNIFSQMYWTVNPRSLMNFLSLRVQSEDSYIMSYPQKEIDYCAGVVEQHFAKLMPATHRSFVANGRMAP